MSCVKTLTAVMFGLQLDSWSVILNGSVEVTYPEGRTELLCMGNSFGVSPTMEKEYMKGVMKTKVDDCQVGRWLQPVCSSLQFVSLSRNSAPRHGVMLCPVVTYFCILAMRKSSQLHTRCCS